ncbi:Alcohol acetyltransferase [Hypoxylon texense]
MAAVLNPSELIDSSTTDSLRYTRLHVTPLDESLLSIVVPSSVLPRARNISYHTIETFPEKRYGFVDLPLADAEKIKNKLNGAVLRGSKMRVEKAKPETIPQPTGDAGATDTKKEKKEKKKSQKRKREADVTPGIELEGRKVKRGWTMSEREMIEEKRKNSKRDKKSKDDKDKKKKKKKHVKSKYTDGPECLFKTKLPDAGPSSKNTDDAVGHGKKRKSSREVVVHEFEKTTKHPSFLKSTAEKSSSKAVTFEDGIGWVDENGTVVEPVVSRRPRDHSSKSNSAEPQVSKATPVVEDDDTSSSGSSLDDSEDDEVSDDESNNSDEEKAETMAPPKKLKVETLALNSPTSNTKTESARPKSSSSVTSLTIKIPPATPATTSATKVHPLEALYKRPKGDAATTSAPQEAQPFSFFDADDEDIEEENTVGRSSQPPMTPFTKQDFEFRNMRSAAPTPDTAHPSSRTFNLWPRQNSVDEGDEEDGDEEDGNDEDTIMVDTSNETTAAGGSKQAPVSDFQKQFWESRGDLNRSWRKRRKAASKEKRYRENRARADRAI